MNVRVREVRADDRAEWIRMRGALWPAEPDDHPPEIDAYFERPPANATTFVVERPDGGLGGFVEVGLRDYAEGCVTSPVGYLEGLWIDPDLRRRGSARGLVAVAEDWARARGCREMASDTVIDNTRGEAFHRALGYAEVERIICFRKDLA